MLQMKSRNTNNSYIRLCLNNVAFYYVIKGDYNYPVLYYAVAFKGISITQSELIQIQKSLLSMRFSKLFY